MIRTYTAAQIRTAETRALARTPPGSLMMRAARTVADATAHQLARPLSSRPLSSRPLPSCRVLLLVGAGNNGADALYAGRDLRRRGVSVTAILAFPERVHTEALVAFGRARGRVVNAQDAQCPPLFARADAIIDGLVGLGARLPLAAPLTELVSAANAADTRRIAVDIPSGVDPDHGYLGGTAFEAHVTVTFGGHKTGLLLARQSGDIQREPIGMDPAQWAPDAGWNTDIVTDDDILRLPQPGIDDHKFSTGPVGIVAGSAQYPGAAVLSVGGAVRLRPGLVRYVGPQSGPVLDRWPEVVATGQWESAGSAAAWAIGPGIGTDDTALELLSKVLAVDVPVIIDADALTLIAAHRRLLTDRSDRSVSTVLTPHTGEFSRLFPELSLDDRVAAARRAARDSGAIVLLKGHRTIVAEASGRTAINVSGSPWLATAGSGDVLTGLVVSLLATGMDPYEASAMAAHLHGRAGQRAEVAQDPGASALLRHLTLPLRQQM